MGNLALVLEIGISSLSFPKRKQLYFGYNS
jgi:hypothetical protein